MKELIQAFQMQPLKAIMHVSLKKKILKRLFGKFLRKFTIECKIKFLEKATMKKLLEKFMKEFSK